MLCMITFRLHIFGMGHLCCGTQENYSKFGDDCLESRSFQGIIALDFYQPASQIVWNLGSTYVVKLFTFSKIIPQNVIKVNYDYAHQAENVVGLQ